MRMALVSGRPISFQMDLYQPLYVPRPMVEPELFASLRPPTHSGNMAMSPDGKRLAGGSLGLATDGTSNGLSVKGTSRIHKEDLKEMAENWGRLPERERAVQMKRSLPGIDYCQWRRDVERRTCCTQRLCSSPSLVSSDPTVYVTTIRQEPGARRDLAGVRAVGNLRRYAKVCSRARGGAS